MRFRESVQPSNVSLLRKPYETKTLLREIDRLLGRGVPGIADARRQVT
jgi:hypothetical protein